MSKREDDLLNAANAIIAFLDPTARPADKAEISAALRELEEEGLIIMGEDGRYRTPYFANTRKPN